MPWVINFYSLLTPKGYTHR